MKASKSSKASRPGLADLKRLRAKAAATPDAGAAAPRRRPAGRHGPPADIQDTAGQPCPPDPAKALDPADRALFRQAMRFVQPLRNTASRAPGRARRAPEDWLRARRAHAAGLSETDDTPPIPPAMRRWPAGHIGPDDREFLHPGCGTDVLRSLRRGKWPIEATLDLHGSTLERMDERMDRFLASCLDHGVRCVRIVHGKGHGSRTGVAILKAAVRRRLSQLEAVRAWIECSESEGGAGAVKALLRHSTTKDSS